MKYFFSCILMVSSMLFCIGQPAQVLPGFEFEKAELENQLRYIASDELAGRRTASPGERLAAEYIVSYFEKYGVSPAPGTDHFRQSIPFEKVIPPLSGTLTLGETVYQLGDNLLIMRGDQCGIKAEAVFAGHGWVDAETGMDDYSGLDVKGKVVFVLPGKPGEANPMETFKAMSVKREIAAGKGAVALIELFRLNFPWPFFKSYFGKERLEMKGEQDPSTSPSIIYGWMKESAPNPVKDMEHGEKMTVSIETSGVKVEETEAFNIVGMVEGSDPVLKDQYLLVSAHYDHIGTGKDGGQPYSPQDSIFNGARDNGMGTVALMAAARAIAAHPPKRSVIFLACTGEEMGLLGSLYYAEHPLLPLEKTVFNFNNDGAGYNSTEHVTVIGLEKTNASPLLEKGAAAFNLTVVPDPAPEQNLYERSDNASFANKGIPAIDYAPGITAMNEDIFKYYHQAADNPDSIDYDYLLQFCKAFAFTAHLLADWEGDFGWMPGQERARQ
ncbi:MAG: M28 family peptidase [Lewinellaceae bacterium]|nr:M28 family peptidase [Saprospiraceae bacterium]MCB9340142.1 M28 family peptidase [Lewinellaceae bacterium]